MFRAGLMGGGIEPLSRANGLTRVSAAPRRQPGSPSVSGVLYRARARSQPHGDEQPPAYPTQRLQRSTRNPVSAMT
jgi:hypothetical protein